MVDRMAERSGAYGEAIGTRRRSFARAALAAVGNLLSSLHVSSHERARRSGVRTVRGFDPTRGFDPSTLLPRDTYRLDDGCAGECLRGASVLVTGGGGSIGSELCRQAMRFSPAMLTILDTSENNGFELLEELRRTYGRDVRVRLRIGSVQDTALVRSMLSELRPDVVFHAAAHKHVPLMEQNAAEAVKNNVLGTRNLLDAASAAGVGRFVLLSTDKAVNPTSVMGATKRACELLTQLYASRTPMRCMAVRFGNVLGSSSSVIPLFERQIMAGGPVTVTDPEVTRYFMTIPEAAQLALRAAVMADSGAVYVLDMGAPVRIADVATRMIRQLGHVPDRDIQIAYTGLRDGEKLHEELLTAAERECASRTAHDSILIAPPARIDPAAFCRLLDALEQAALQNAPSLRPLLWQLVESYRPAGGVPESIAN